MALAMRFEFLASGVSSPLAILATRPALALTHAVKAWTAFLKARRIIAQY
jgi:hypothetical protein